MLYAAITGFGTQGSQVRILPLRPEIIRVFRLISTFGQVGHVSAAEMYRPFWPIAAPALRTIQVNDGWRRPGENLRRYTREPGSPQIAAPRLHPRSRLAQDARSIEPVAIRSSLDQLNRNELEAPCPLFRGKIN